MIDAAIASATTSKRMTAQATNWSWKLGRVMLFAALYWLVDIRKRRRWTTLLAPAAASPLLTYIIPYIVYAAMQVLHLSLPEALGHGAAGLLWAVAYSCTVVTLAAVLGRMGLKLQL